MRTKPFRNCLRVLLALHVTRRKLFRSTSSERGGGDEINASSQAQRVLPSKLHKVGFAAERQLDFG